MPCSNTHLAGTKFLGSRDRLHRMIVFCNLYEKVINSFGFGGVKGPAEPQSHVVIFDLSKMILEKSD